MKRLASRLLALLLTAVLLFGALPLVSSAATYEKISYSVPWFSMRRASDCAICSICMAEAYARGYGSNNEDIYYSVFKANGSVVKIKSWADMGYKTVKVSMESIYNNLKAGTPVIVGVKKVYYNADGEKVTNTHYAVVTGYNGSASKLSWSGFTLLSPYHPSDSYNVIETPMTSTGAIGKTTLAGLLSKYPTLSQCIVKSSNKIKIETAPKYAASPVLSTSNFAGGVNVTLKTSTAGATIYYTTNGKKPTTSSAKYTGAFKLTASATVKAIAVKSGMTSSGVMSKSVTVSKTATPVISGKASKNGYEVSISAESGATVYYTTNGSAPTTASAKYAGSFSIGDTVTVKAIAVKSGKAISAVASSTLTGAAPTAPKPRLTSAAEIGVEDEITLTWDKLPSAYEYVALLYRDGALVREQTSQGGAVSFVAEAPGAYAAAVKAVNFIGESAESAPALKVTVHPDVRVTFADDDGTVLNEQTVHWGKNAVPPTAPSKTGHTFKAWSGDYTGVKADATVTAQYTPNTYTVVFRAENGDLLASAVAEYGSAVTPPEAPAKTGFAFTGWSVVSGSGSSYEAVDGDVTFAPIYVWANPDLPLGVAIDFAKRSADSRSYRVSLRVTNHSDKTVNGRLITVIKTENDKVTATEVDAVEVPAGAVDQAFTVTVGSTADAKRCEVYVVAADPEVSARAGGALSEKAACAVTREEADTYSYWTEWSDWTEVAATESETREVEVKTQYRWRDKETTTSTSSSLSGWTLSGSSVSYGSWGSWSDWSTTAQTASDVKDVAKRTVYKYSHYCDGNGHIAPSSAYTYGKYGPHTLYFTSKKAVSRSGSGGYSITDGLTKCAKGSGSYYYMGTATQYRYRTRTKTTTYSFWRWGAWSAWSDSPVTASENRETDTRTVYRYRDLVTETATEIRPYDVEEDLSGTVYGVAGKLDLAENFSGKTATVMVYKGKNTDALESQLEYVGQITLGEGNRFDFTFIPREEITSETGDYIVSFGIATADKAVNNAYLIPAPKPTYAVSFFDADGALLTTVNVPEGEDAPTPALPEKEGYTVRWNRTATNITGNTVIRAEAVPMTYNVIFVDWANDRILAIREAAYGSTVEFPDDPTAEGKVFAGWSMAKTDKVSGTTVVEAIYEDLTYNVTFLNRDGSVFAESKAVYGEAAAIPEEVPTSDGYVFIAWETDSGWWNVTGDLTVKPIFVYETTVETPMYEMGAAIPGETAVTLETTTDDAVIFFTLDGSEPTRESNRYTDILWLSDEDLAGQTVARSKNGNVILKAKAMKSGMNDSEVVTFEVESHTDDLPSVFVLTEDTNRYVIGETEAKLPMVLLNPGAYEIGVFGYTLYKDQNFDASVKSASYETLVGRTDKAAGVQITVKDLTPGTQYTVQFFVETDAGLLESDLVTFKTLGGDGSGDDTPDFAPGDVDFDGKVTASDARLALRRAVDLESFPQGSAAFSACDVDKDDKVTASDARIILRAAVGLETLD